MSQFSLRKSLRGLVLAGFALLLPAIGFAQTSFPGSTGANAACGSASLGTYQGLGFAGCTVGAATFYNFTSSVEAYDGNGNPYTPDYLNGITLAPVATGSMPAIGFTSATLFSLAPSSGTVTYTIEYYVDPPIDILGYGLADDPFAGDAYVTADVCVGNTFDINCPPQDIGIESAGFHTNLVGNNTNEYFYYIDPNDPTDFSFFDNTTQFLDVILTINLDSTNGAASIAGITASVQTAVPEPSDLALTSIGGLALLGATLRRRRTKAARS